MDYKIGTFDTTHNGPIHDVQMDYYGKRLATASGDHSVRVWDITRQQPILVAKLEGHESPVWEVCILYLKYKLSRFLGLIQNLVICLQVALLIAAS